MMAAVNPAQLRIHASDEFLPPDVPHVALLYPFWGLPASEHAHRNVYGPFIEGGREHFRLVTAKEADFFVLPFDWRYTSAIFAPTETTAKAARALGERFSQRAADLGKKVVVFYVSDFGDEVPLPNSVVFRTSMKRDLRKNEFAMPVFVEDFVGERIVSGIPLRPKLRSPSVGFCGFAGYRLTPDVNIWRRTRSWARWVRKGMPADTPRERAIRGLRKHPSVVTDFVLREHGIQGLMQAQSQPVRDAFKRNLLNNDYTLCARGRGNWSIRFYETLSFARIPVFIDTDCVLPYDFHVDYRDVMVWVDNEHAEDAGNQLVRFHDSLSDAGFEELQRTCRRLWEKRLTPEGFFSDFHTHFETFD
jgi:hypothetical protein